ncbi:chlorhexidine efflux PACE transporter AceI [Acinetobacter sp. MD2(2019)]|uniref:chlorhexidine efflux PACE transporter AceI n=1 Tax=Acinetobacter sp. MD2(2019) TaxID=2605273 RepID=UPI002D1E7AFB|nr:chlorhexidine efflux PACE transporter AceI [Acinetobacter sp. MD2(2019)]MEB3752885.1 chlorhexidine efflux PACE transporter AceI [Acinetobacter sp. MD2(2019)]
MLISKKRIIHAVMYEAILLVVIAYGLSYFFSLPLEESGLLMLIMCGISVFWNMIFNALFEKAEQKYQFKRTVFFRILHAIGFEGGLMIITIPIFAYTLKMNLIDAFLLDFGITNCIFVYTFIYQWCFDAIEQKWFSAKNA